MKIEPTMTPTVKTIGELPADTPPRNHVNPVTTSSAPVQLFRRRTRAIRPAAMNARPVGTASAIVAPRSAPTWSLVSTIATTPAAQISASVHTATTARDLTPRVLPISGAIAAPRASAIAHRQEAAELLVRERCPRTPSQRMVAEAPEDEDQRA